MDGLYFWIPRWFKSKAYRELTLTQQGAYLNLLFEAALRDGVLPDDERLWHRICGYQRRSKLLLAVVKKQFTKGHDGWHNKTLDEAVDRSHRRIARQKRWREKHETSHETFCETPARRDQDQDQDQPIPIIPSLTRRNTNGRRKYDVGGTNCPHTPCCRSTKACIEKRLSWDES